jgi:hypothetical protein
VHRCKYNGQVTVWSWVDGTKHAASGRGQKSESGISNFETQSRIFLLHSRSRNARHESDVTHCILYRVISELHKCDFCDGGNVFADHLMRSELDPGVLPLSPSSKIPLALRQNTTNPETKWLVQKYGGTSVGKFAVNIARDTVS